ncbi:DUF6973 domain-containing protein [Paenibacillus sp. PL91]|uniref:DUF6973 domain-containing protein n=1 Tax=Paenibacillus sp. PL91 TaxID=2729538 RepID=UPI00145D20B9|nr:hypothetical protein [Paenibacillus sp. PL91]MBC9204052.1 hypothetical protein [Paenibacillus sp. PL91]
MRNEIHCILTFDSDTVKLFKEIEKFKRDHPELTSPEVSKQFEQKLDNLQQKNSFSALASYDSYVAKWNALTEAEKVLVIRTTGQALIVDSMRRKAVEYEANSKYKGLDGNGTKRDAFRHAIWNALMVKYINKLSAYAWATDHEAQDDPSYYDQYFDGFTGRQHKVMDLHNKEKGRDSWNFWTDSILWTSD